MLLLVDQESTTQEQRTITSKLSPQMSWMVMTSKYTSSTQLRQTSGGGVGFGFTLTIGLQLVRGEGLNTGV